MIPCENKCGKGDTNGNKHGSASRSKNAHNIKDWKTDGTWYRRDSKCAVLIAFSAALSVPVRLSEQAHCFCDADKFGPINRFKISILQGSEFNIEASHGDG